MAITKPTFAKMNLKMRDNVITIFINDQEVEVKQYLSINDKLKLIGNVLSQAADDNNFSNPVKLKVFTDLEIVFAYTNISFTDKQKEDLVKLYDILESNGVFDVVNQALDADEYKTITQGVKQCSEAFYTYKNSAVGILDTISSDYSNLELDANKLQSVMADPSQLSFLKDVLTKLG